MKLVDVPHSYWTREGLKHIASAVGVPLSLDNQTATLNPMKYAGVLVEITYDCAYPKAVCVPVIDEDSGEVVKVRVGIDYSSVPQSCSYCKAFGHYDSRCEKNPSYVKPPTKEKAPVKKGKEKAEFMGCPVEMDPVGKTTPAKQTSVKPTTPASDVGTSNKFAVLEEGEIDASADTEVMDTDSEHVDATIPVGDALPQDSPVVLMECPIDAPSVPLVRPSASAPERAPSAPLVSSTAAVLESAPVAPLECSIDAPSEPLVQPSASALVNAPSGAPSAP